MQLPRDEYPRPQFTRPDWLCLNGEWEFEIDHDDTGRERGLLDQPLCNKITVPFCPESPLSGIGETGFMNAVWYRRTVLIPEAWRERRVLLHFQAVDYDTTVWVNGVEAGRHRGGFTPFTCDLNHIAVPGEPAVIVVRARDYSKRPQALGKQCHEPENYGCLYTRTTGIWQSVWLEPVPESYLLRPRITPDVGSCMFRLEQRIAGGRPGQQLRAVLQDDSGEVSHTASAVGMDFSVRLDLPVPEARYRLWSPGDPHLYTISLMLFDEKDTVIDSAESYAGLRSITIEGMAVRINGEIVFQRLVLDQGYYPEGIMTAPTDEALQQDITLSMAAGFNGARLHQKVFEERFLYHADKLGYLIWGEFGDWGCAGQGENDNHQQPDASYITQWLEALERDYSHPCIIGWCPLNETWQFCSDRIHQLDDVTRGMFLATKAMDGTRPVLDTSGYSHRVPESDIYDSHDYEQQQDAFAANHAGLAIGQPFLNKENGKDVSIPWRGQPFFISEFGGIWWHPGAAQDKDSWGYGDRPKSEEEFYSRFKYLCDILLDDPLMFGYCYTQLTDVFQEQNGIYAFNRDSKFDLNRLKKVQQRRAAIEEEEV